MKNSISEEEESPPAWAGHETPNSIAAEKLVCRRRSAASSARGWCRFPNERENEVLWEWVLANHLF